jgi:N-methyl-L-tryptophan oxidase
VCKYELTPDDHFIIDSHPEFPSVLLAGGFSGHGFKFSSAVGELLADRVERGSWGQDVGLFSASRFAQTAK